MDQNIIALDCAGYLEHSLTSWATLAIALLLGLTFMLKANLKKPNKNVLKILVESIIYGLLVFAVLYFSLFSLGFLGEFGLQITKASKAGDVFEDYLIYSAMSGFLFLVGRFLQTSVLLTINYFRRPIQANMQSTYNHKKFFPLLIVAFLTLAVPILSPVVANAKEIRAQKTLDDVTIAAYVQVDISESIFGFPGQCPSGIRI